MIKTRDKRRADRIWQSNFDELLAELEQIIEPIQIHRERLTEICGELAAAMEAPEQPAKQLERIGNVAKRLQPTVDLSQDQRRHVARMIEPTKVDRGQFERIAKAVRPFESVLRELRRVENWIDRQRKLSSGA